MLVVGYNKILEELKRGAVNKPELAEIVSFYIDLLSAQARTDVSSCESGALAQEAVTRLGQGLPILTLEAFQADRVALANLFDEIRAITARHRPELATSLAAIGAWLEKKRASILQLAVAYLCDGGEVYRGEAGLDGSLLTYILNHARRPFLRRYAKALAPFVDESIWYRPRCPICGGKPDFSALAKPTGARRLLCSRCDFEWAFWRVACPFCGCDDPDQQKYSVTEDRVYRLYTCEQCKRYLKTIDLREIAAERVLPVERILTLTMDVQAQEAGYGAPPG